MCATFSLNVCSLLANKVQVTHGFPQNPSPLFHSTQFSIENRPGLEDQNLERVMTTLSKLEAPSLYPGSESYKKIELAKWLSDWHLVVFLQTTQLFSQVLYDYDILFFIGADHYPSTL